MAHQEFIYTFVLNDITFVDVLIENQPFLKVKSLATNSTTLPLANVELDSPAFTDAIEELRSAAAEANEPADILVTLITKEMDANLSWAVVFPPFDRNYLKYLGSRPERYLPENLLYRLSNVIDGQLLNFIRLEESREDCWKALMIINKNRGQIVGAYDDLNWNTIFVKLKNNRIIRIAYGINNESELHPFLDYRLNLGLHLQSGFFVHDESSQLDSIFDGAVQRSVRLQLDHYADIFRQWDGKSRLLLPANNPFSEMTRELEYICMQAEIERDKNRRALVAQQNFRQALRLITSLASIVFAGAVFKYGLFAVLHPLSLLIFAASTVGIAIYGIKYRQQIWDALCDPKKKWQEWSALCKKKWQEWGANTFDRQTIRENWEKEIPRKLKLSYECLFGKEGDKKYFPNAVNRLAEILQPIADAVTNVDDKSTPEYFQCVQWLNRQYERLCGVGKVSKYSPTQILNRLECVNVDEKAERIKKKYPTI